MVDIRLELAHDNRWLIALIAAGDWPALRDALKEHQEELEAIDSRRGWTILHYMCALPSIPNDIFETAVQLYPEATCIQGGAPYGHLPLHVLCDNPDHSLRKAQILLEHMRPHDLLVTSHLRGSVIHHAYRKQAPISTLRELIRANPKIVLLHHHYQFTALHADQYGLMQTRYILKGIKVNEKRFQEYWDKVILIATVAFKQSPNYSRKMEANIEQYTLHGLQFLRAPNSIQRVAAKLHPEYVSIADGKGNYPLHNAIREAAGQNGMSLLDKEILSAFPEAAIKRNKKGCAPLFVAMRNGMTWEKGIKEFVLAHPESLFSIDHETGLCPFQFAASLNEDANMETSYQLLCANPSLLKA